MRRLTVGIAIPVIFMMPLVLSLFWIREKDNFDEIYSQELSSVSFNSTADKYLSFEPWNGGWNNRRMSLEMAFLICFLTNRTLVLPPKSSVHHMDASSYEDFFNISKMMKFVSVVRWSDYEDMILLKRSRKRKVSCKSLYSTKNTLGFCRRMKAGRERSDALVNWNIINSVIQIPANCTSNLATQKDIKLFAPRFNSSKYLGKAFEELDIHSTVHFPQNLFGLFYTTFYFSDRSKRKEAYRVVRDGIQFRSSIQSLANQVVDSLGGQKSYSCLHVRRGDFKKSYGYLDVGNIALRVKEQLASVTYVASDDLSKTFANDLQSMLTNTVIRTKSDFSFLSVFVDPIELGVVEQLICSQADIFIGTRFSTFSSYITRLRGYNPNITNKEIYLLDEPYNTKHPKRLKEHPYSWRPFTGYTWSREFHESWNIPQSKMD